MPESSPCAPARRLECHARQATNFAKHFLQLVHQLQRALRIIRALVRMHSSKPGSFTTSSFIFGLYFIVHEPSG